MTSALPLPSDDPNRTHLESPPGSGMLLIPLVNRELLTQSQVLQGEVDLGRERRPEESDEG